MYIRPTNAYIRPTKVYINPTYSRSDQTKVFLIKVQLTYDITDLQQLENHVQVGKKCNIEDMRRAKNTPPFRVILMTTEMAN